MEEHDPKQVIKMKISQWKGILAEEDKLFRRMAAVVLMVAATSMAFTQFGFVGVGTEGEYSFYIMALYVPIALAALLFGRHWGLAMGFLSGCVHFAHAMLQPLDLYERYMITPFSSIVIFAISGWVFNRAFGRALRFNPTGKRRVGYIALSCLVAMFINSLLFTLGVFTSAVIESMISYFQNPDGWLISGETYQVLKSLGMGWLQFGANYALVFVASALLDYLYARYKVVKNNISLRAIFKGWLLVVVALAFMVTSAVSFVITTEQALMNANASMDGDLEYLVGSVDSMQEYALETDDLAKTYHMSESDVKKMQRRLSYEKLITEYKLGIEGTTLVVKDCIVLASNNAAYRVGSSLVEILGNNAGATIDYLVSTSEMRQTVYLDGDDVDEAGNLTYRSSEIGYMGASRSQDGTDVVIILPSSKVFAVRTGTITWMILMSLVLLAAVYVLVSALTKQLVIRQIDKTNESLGLITDGDLDERLAKVGIREFDSLSYGINTTVDALNGWIQEAETRMARELTTAKAIQEGALPSTFPPFPEVEAFDLYASMNAAKEVGGDFYDFFLIDDHTLGFLIADVSGKGIPASLYMMTAMTHLENYMSTGMDLAQAISSANAHLCSGNTADMFVTVWAATLDWRTGDLTFVNAGHNPPLLRHGRQGTWEWINKRGGLFLGTFETAKYRSSKLTLQKGDELLLYTDGVNEAFNVNEEEYSNVRLEEFCAAHNDLHPKDMVLALREDVAAWATGAEQSDDVTILALEFGEAPDVSGSVTVPAVIDNLVVANRMIRDELRRRLCPVDVRNRVSVALEELFVNVCNYAYVDQDEPGSVQVNYVYRADPRSITVELVDQGVPFDPTTRKDPTKPANIQETKVGGLGIFMVRKSMDDFTYMRDGDSNKVVFQKRW